MLRGHNMTRRISGYDHFTRTLWMFALAMLTAATLRLASSAHTASGTIIPGEPFTAGQSYFGRNKYVEYIAGNAPVILSAAHGGDVKPPEIPDRSDTCGASANTIGDAHTRELVIAMQQAFHARFGSFPHVVINHLHRSKLDANRPISDAACGNSDAGVAWLNYHTFVDIAKLDILKKSGKGW